MKKVSAEVNGKKVTKEIPDHTLLSVFLRDILNLTGTHVGCDTSQCGACVVHVDGKSIKSCTAFAADVNGSKITTIEGISKHSLSQVVVPPAPINKSDLKIKLAKESLGCITTKLSNFFSHCLRNSKYFDFLEII